MKSRMALLAVALLASVVLAGCTPSIHTKFDVAKDLQNKGQFAQAITAYEQYIAETKDSTIIPNALRNIALCHWGMYKKAEALAAFQKVIDQYPSSEPAQWAKVEMDRLKNMELVPPPAKPKPQEKPKAPAAK